MNETPITEHRENIEQSVNIGNWIAGGSKPELQTKDEFQEEIDQEWKRIKRSRQEQKDS